MVDRTATQLPRLQRSHLITEIIEAYCDNIINYDEALANIYSMKKKERFFSPTNFKGASTEIAFANMKTAFKFVQSKEIFQMGLQKGSANAAQKLILILTGMQRS